MPKPRPNFILLVLVLVLAVAVGVFSANVNHGRILSLASVDNFPGLITHGSRNKKEVALTFDADMTYGMINQLKDGEVSSWYNKKVIDVLKSENVPATLFLTGLWIETYPSEAKSFAQNPLFELGNHSYFHPGFETGCYSLEIIPDSSDDSQIRKTQDLLFNLTGFQNRLFRFPGGCYSQFDLDTVNKFQLNVVGWDVVSSDAFNTNTNQIISNVVSGVQNGSIVVMHMMGGANAPKTGDALPEIIKGLRAKGFTFVKVSDLLE